jgi:hypothetical protein
MIPELELDSSVIRQITVYFKDAESDRRGKPAHVHGVELRWQLLDNVPSSECATVDKRTYRIKEVKAYEKRTGY